MLKTANSAGNQVTLGSEGMGRLPQGKCKITTQLSLSEVQLCHQLHVFKMKTDAVKAAKPLNGYFHSCSNVH